MNRTLWSLTKGVSPYEVSPYEISRYEVSPYEVAHVASSLAPCLKQLRLIDLHAALSVIQLG